MTDTTPRVKLSVAANAKEYRIEEVGTGWGGCRVYATGRVWATSLDEVKQAITLMSQGNDVEGWRDGEDEYCYVLLADILRDPNTLFNTYLVFEEATDKLVLAKQINQEVWLELVPPAS